MRNAAQMMVENEVRKRRKMEQEAQQKKEEMDLQNMANKLAQEQEERRNAEVKARSDKINNMIKAGENTVNKLKTRKDEEEARIMKYWKRKNEQTDKKEAMIQMREKENKVLYKQFLDQQIIEKQARAKFEKEHIKQQAALWSTDIELFNQAKINKQIEAKNDLQAYRETLDEQINEKLKKDKTKTVSVDEKGDLLQRIQELENTKMNIEAQLAVFGS